MKWQTISESLAQTSVKVQLHCEVHSDRTAEGEGCIQSALTAPSSQWTVSPGWSSHPGTPSSSSHSPHHPSLFTWRHDSFDITSISTALLRNHHHHQHHILHVISTRPWSTCQLIFNIHDVPMPDRQAHLTNSAVGWYLRPIFPTRAVSIFRHRRANGVLLVCAAAVLLGKVDLHFFVVAFFLLPGVNRHCDVQSRC